MAIDRFLKASSEPVVLEPGEDPFPLQKDHYLLESRGGRLTLQVWDETRNLTRRVTGVRGEKRGRLELAIEKLGKRTGVLLLLDKARPTQAAAQLHGKRLIFREEFRRFLGLQFPGWKLTELSTEPNLEHSLSPVYPRAFLKRGQSGLAALGCPRNASDSAGALSFGLIWLDYLRRRERRVAIEELAIFLPHGLERATLLRMRFLDARTTQLHAFVYSPEGYLERAEPADCGNLDTKLEPCRTGLPRQGPAEDWVDRLCRQDSVERVTSGDGSTSLRVRGIQFARAAGGELRFGLERMTPARESNLEEIQRLAAELARLRAPGAGESGNPLYRRQPERWLESQVRSRIEDLDATLLSEPIYGQVPALAGGERGVLDLLAVDRMGRLAVLELKTTEDIHLPLQALDYWIRVRWHLERGEFTRFGYFPGIELSGELPRLLLVAPSLHFHPTTEVLLRHFGPEIAVERIGIGVEWRRRLKVMFRISGAERPA